MTSSHRAYLDWNASAPLLPEAREAMLRAMDVRGNPSSVHAEGRAARSIVDDAREAVARLINADPADLVFTSGATEANAMVLAGQAWDAVFAAPIEHPSVLKTRNISPLRVEASGRVVIDDATIAAAPAKSLWSIQLANGETGISQDLRAIANTIRSAAPGAIVHTDAVQAVGKVPVDFAALDVDALTISAHKLGGPKGVGALVAKPRAKLAPIVAGGGQERGRRGGTENVIAIAGFGAAARAAERDLARMTVLERRRDQFEQAVLQATPSAVVIGKGVARLPNTTMLALRGQRAETLVIRLDLAGIAVSAGAACSSGKVGPNPVLAAMGLAPDIAECAIRISIGPSTTDNELAAFLAAWTSIAVPAPRRAA